MAWDPYAVLGLAPSASKSEAKAAYRKLAQQHHPDREGGDKARFQEIKAAWEWIESDKPVPQETTAPTGGTPYKSSFGDPPGSFRPPPRASEFGAKPKPAPGYEARGPRNLPRTYSLGKSGRIYSENWGVNLEVTTKQAFEGCVVPFLHRGVQLEFIVRPGTMMYDAPEQFLMDEMIGAQRGTVTVHVKLKVVDPKPAPPPPPPKEEQTADQHVVFRICALGLFSGGKIETRDYLNEVVPISIPPGYDPAKPIVVKGKGYGPKDRRGDLVVKIEPVFKAPNALNSNELKMLDRLNEMTK